MSSFRSAILALLNRYACSCPLATVEAPTKSAPGNDNHQALAPETPQVTSMLFPEENTLAIMKWRLLQTAPSNRWYPVLERYITYIAARVDGLGGNSKGILPSPNGVPPQSVVKDLEREYTGKVCEVLFELLWRLRGVCA